MACAVGKIEPVLPQRCAGYRVDIAPARTRREAQHRNADHALQHQRIVLAHLVGRSTHGYGAGDVGGAVLILPAGIDQEQLAIAEHAVGGTRNAVMHDRAIRARSGDGREGDVAQRHLRFLADCRTERFQPLDRRNLVDRAGLLPVQPGEHLGNRSAVAAVRSACTGNLGVVLGCARDARRVLRLDDLAAVFGDEQPQLFRRKRRIKRDARAGSSPGRSGPARAPMADAGRKAG